MLHLNNRCPVALGLAPYPLQGRQLRSHPDRSSPHPFSGLTRVCGGGTRQIVLAAAATLKQHLTQSGYTGRTPIGLGPDGPEWRLPLSGFPHRLGVARVPRASGLVVGKAITPARSETGQPPPRLEWRRRPTLNGRCRGAFSRSVVATPSRSEHLEER